MTKRPSRFVRYLTLVSFLPASLALLVAAVIDNDAVAVASAVWLVGTAMLFLMVEQNRPGSRK